MFEANRCLKLLGNPGHGPDSPDSADASFLRGYGRQSAITVYCLVAAQQVFLLGDTTSLLGILGLKSVARMYHSI